MSHKQDSKNPFCVIAQDPVAVRAQPKSLQTASPKKNPISPSCGNSHNIISNARTDDDNIVFVGTAVGDTQDDIVTIVSPRANYNNDPNTDFLNIEKSFGIQLEVDSHAQGRKVQRGAGVRYLLDR